ncbi:GNAT family N-acetyltransferase [Halobacillus sp. Marseille-P3879]|uniref:GNAT family N-acetyltransferase n=1 Tax=Halobacillus sp. Marseille-P3879 TaxID=2045014 RepID=UPI000C7A30A3|nr:GNAT family N-acetyltransferase [Halobacillus sp. Marseille-P3879]
MIREAVINDSDQMTRLMNTLGYPTSSTSLERRLEAIIPDGIYQTYVYEQQGMLEGMIGMMHCKAYHTEDTHVRVIAFVVEQHAQGQGIGRRLMDKAEQWARKRGANRITLNSGNREERNQAHSIYEHLGFIGKATGFYKEI